MSKFYILKEHELFDPNDMSEFAVEFDGDLREFVKEKIEQFLMSLNTPMSKGCRMTFKTGNNSYSALIWGNFIRKMVVVNDGERLMAMPMDIWLGVLIGTAIAENGEIIVDDLKGDNIMKLVCYDRGEEAA